MINITIAKSWNELTDWQIAEIAHLYLNTTEEEFADAYEKMILYVYLKNDSRKERKLFKFLTKQVPISELAKHTDFLLKTTSLSRFPEITGLIKPADGLGDITIRHFSTIDIFFFQWHENRSEVSLKRLVASLYRIKEQFDDIDLPEVNKITSKLSIKQMEAIALSYMFIRRSIQDDFPVVFPVKEETEEEKFEPVFHKKNTYVPFDRIIISMAMDELQPLGKKQDVNNVRIYEFLAVLSESILYHRQKSK